MDAVENAGADNSFPVLQRISQRRYRTGSLSRIVFVGVNDYMLRNLLCSSFPARARQLRVQLHGLVYPDSYPVYRETLEKELGMTSEPQELVRLSDWNLPSLERLAFRSGLYRCGRVNSHTYRAVRRQG